MTENDGYTSVRLPNNLIKQIDEIISDDSLGYRSRNEFCVDAVRRWVWNFTMNKKIEEFGGGENKGMGSD